MKNASDILNVFGSNVSAAKLLGVTPSGVSEMKRRNSIPVRHWPRVIDEAEKAGARGVNVDLLIRLMSRKARKTPKKRTMEAAQ